MILVLHLGAGRWQAEAKLLQNYNICGLFVSQWSNDFDNDDMVRTQCFQGIGLTSCQHVGKEPSLTQYPFHPDSMFVLGVNWCLECCNSARIELEFDETWNLKCPVPEATTVPRIYDEIASPFGMRDWWFRFGELKDPKDMDIVECPLIRESDVSDNMVLEGYHLTLTIVEHLEGIEYWRGVIDCKAEALEVPIEEFFANDPPIFTERLTLIYSSDAPGRVTPGTPFAAAVAALVSGVLLAFR